MKAGDVAPKISWTSIAQSPDWQTPPDLLGRVTVILFFPNVSADARMILEWNNLADRFADRPVNFVWLISETNGQEAAVRGWLLLDEHWETARAYGVEMGGAAVVDRDGKIAGFAFLQPSEEQINAVLKGNAAPALDPEPFRMPAHEGKPDIPTSYEVSISPAKTAGVTSSEGPDFWVQRGFDLRAILSSVYGQDPSRIILPASLDSGDRFDFVLALPRDEDQDTKQLILKRGIEKHFQVLVAVERKAMDVYAMTAIEGKTPAAKTADDGGSMTWSSHQFTLPEGQDAIWETLQVAAAEMLSGARPPGVSSVSANNATMDAFGRLLEQGLSRPVVDETNLQGSYDLSVRGDSQKPEEFFQVLRDQLGLVLTPARRDIEMLVVTSLTSLQR